MNPLGQKEPWILTLSVATPHIQSEYRTPLREEMGHNALVFVPDNCASFLQALDRSFMRAFKTRVRKLATRYYVQSIMKGFASEEELQLDIGLTTLESIIPRWVTEPCDSLLDTPSLWESRYFSRCSHAVHIEICQGQLRCGLISDQISPPTRLQRLRYLQSILSLVQKTHPKNLPRVFSMNRNWRCHRWRGRPRSSPWRTSLAWRAASPIVGTMPRTAASSEVWRRPASGDHRLRSGIEFAVKLPSLQDPTWCNDGQDRERLRTMALSAGTKRQARPLFASQVHTFHRRSHPERITAVTDATDRAATVEALDVLETRLSEPSASSRMVTLSQSST